MRGDDLLTFVSTPLQQDASQAESPTMRILVLVDSSADAFNSLAYTLHIAKVWNAGIHLLYIMDLDKIPDSEGSYVVEGAINRLHSSAAICLESLVELISDTGVTLISAESAMGVAHFLEREIDSIKPNMIAIGRDRLKQYALNSLLSSASCPLLIIPGVIRPGLPKSVALIGEHDRLSMRNLELLINIIKRTSRELHILSAMAQKKNGTRKSPSTLSMAGCAIKLNFYNVEETGRASTIDKFVQTKMIDMVCTVREKESFIKRILYHWNSWAFVGRLNVPILEFRIKGN